MPAAFSAGSGRCSYAFPASAQLRVDLREKWHELSPHTSSTNIELRRRSQPGESRAPARGQAPAVARLCVWGRGLPAPSAASLPQKPGPDKLGSPNPYLFHKGLVPGKLILILTLFIDWNVLLLLVLQ